MKKVNWVFMDSNTTEVYCERCGDRKGLKDKLPLSITAFAIAIEGFEKLHSICKKPAIAQAEMK